MAKIKKLSDKGELIYPATILEAVKDPSTKENLREIINKGITEYNVSVQHPTGGIGGTNKYTLETAIAKIPTAYRNVGIKCSFVDTNNIIRTYVYKGNNWVELIDKIVAQRFSSRYNTDITSELDARQIDSEMVQSVQSNIGFYITSRLAWSANTSNDVGGGFFCGNNYKTMTIKAAVSQKALVAFIAEMPNDVGSAVRFSISQKNVIYIPKGETQIFDIPDDCVFVYVQMVSSNNSWMPASIVVRKDRFARIDNIESRSIHAYNTSNVINSELDARQIDSEMVQSVQSNIGFYITSRLAWSANTSNDVGGGFFCGNNYKTIAIKAAVSQKALVAFIAEMPNGVGSAVRFSISQKNVIYIPKGETQTFDIPDDCVFVYVQMVSSNNSWMPASIVVRKDRFARIDNIESRSIHAYNTSNVITSELDARQIDSEMVQSVQNNIGFYITSGLAWSVNTSNDVGGGFFCGNNYKTIAIKAAISQKALVAFIAEMPNGVGSAVRFSISQKNVIYIPKGETQTFDIPDDCVFVYVQMVSSNSSWMPASIVVRKDGFARIDNIESKIIKSNDDINNLKSDYSEVDKRVGILEAGAGVDPLEKWDVPKNLGVTYAIQKAYDLVNVSTLIRNSLSANNREYNDGDTITGIPYSSVKRYNTFVPNHVSIETYVTAMSSPNSYVYTITPHSGQHEHLYYGIVCIMYAMYCLGIKDNMHINWELFSVKGMTVVPKQSSQSVELADVINVANKNGTHCRVIVGIARKGNVVTRIKLGESVGPTCRIYEVSASSFDKILEEYVLLRYNRLHENTYGGSPFRHIFVNRNLMPKKGNKANYGSQEKVIVDILDVASYTDYAVYRNGILFKTAPINSHDTIDLGMLPYGNYTMRLKNGESESASVEWIVVDANIKAEARQGGFVRFTFSSANGTPISVHWTREKDMMNNVSFTINEQDRVNGYIDTCLSKEELPIKGINGYDIYTKYDYFINDYTTKNIAIIPRLCIETEYGIYTIEGIPVHYIQ